MGLDPATPPNPKPRPARALIVNHARFTGVLAVEKIFDKDSGMDRLGTTVYVLFFLISLVSTSEPDHHDCGSCGE